jgi:hypothetical protein
VKKPTKILESGEEEKATVSTLTPESESLFMSIAKEFAGVVEVKNKQYGDSFVKTPEFLTILWPDGIKPEDYADMLALVRIFDKMMRIAHGKQGEESPWGDMLGYSILALANERKL